MHIFCVAAWKSCSSSRKAGRVAMSDADLRDGYSAPPAGFRAHLPRLAGGRPPNARRRTLIVPRSWSRFGKAWRISRSRIGDLLDWRRTTAAPQLGRLSRLWPGSKSLAAQSDNRLSSNSHRQQDPTMFQIRTDKTAPSFASSEPSETDPAALVAARFRRSGYPPLWDISCEFSEGILTLSGTVPTFFLTQAAQELAAHTPGVRQVNNRLRVANRQAQPRQVEEGQGNDRRGQRSMNR